jgi:peptidoglycan hydrolase-like protein with peptidoglycan-binding domain
MRPNESFIGQPIRSLQTMLRHLAESDSRYQTVIPDGIYGNSTRSAVANFQRIHGIPVTGITDQNTWEAILSEFIPARIQIAEAEALIPILNPNQVIRRGERHPVVGPAQAVLEILSQVYGSIPSPGFSGILDDATSDALSSFQYLNNLPMTGHLDKHTWKHLALHYPLASNLHTSRGSLQDF